MSEGRPDRPQFIALNRYDLVGELARLRSEAPIQTYGRDALTLVRDPGFTLLLVAAPHFDPKLTTKYKHDFFYPYYGYYGISPYWGRMY